MAESPTDGQELPLTDLLDEFARRYDQRLFFRLFPDEDTVQRDGSIFHARHKYPRHLEFFEAGARYRERAAICANRTGKTLAMGAYEVAAHLTGLYPGWWPGRRFKQPIEAWASGRTNETTRDTVQKALLGKVTGEGTTNKGVSGTGVIPGVCLTKKPTWKQGVTNLVDTIEVRHASGGFSLLGIKSYQQGRGSYEGTAKHLIWNDEEPDDGIDQEGIYDECLTRTAIVPGCPEGGIIISTFTPLKGLTKTVLRFMPDMRPDA